MSVDDPLRPPRETPHLGLPVPGDAAAADVPTSVGDLADVLDALAAAGFLRWEPGDLKVSATLSPPTGWLMCNGQAISRSVYADLFAAIGVVYGGGNGSTTFNVPNFVDTVPVGASPSKPRGARGGAETVLLNDLQSGVNRNGGTGWQSSDHSHHVAGGTGHDSPDHDHGIGHWTNTLGAGQQPGSVIGEAAWVSRTTGAGMRHAHDFAVWSGGVSANHSHVFNARNADAAHENMPPFVAVNVFIKT